MRPKQTVVALGEILWDVFPDGPRFGGAPANVACDVAELAAGDVAVSIVSGVGRDDLGERALEELRGHGVAIDAVARLDRPTGSVQVTLDDQGQASYQFAADTAWDAIPWSDELHELAQTADAVCFGTLGQRSETSRATIQRFLQTTPDDRLRVFDINLRPPFWTDEVILQSLELANVLKLNQDELKLLADLLDLSGETPELLRQLIERFSLRLIALTRGADGALLHAAAGEQSELPAEPVEVADTVGAGDSYTAALILGLLRGLPLEKINAWGTRVAAFVSSQSGATPKLPERLRET